MPFQGWFRTSWFLQEALGDEAASCRRAYGWSTQCCHLVGMPGNGSSAFVLQKPFDAIGASGVLVRLRGYLESKTFEVIFN